MDINQTNTLNREPAREGKDERHICPLQLDVIERALQLWTNPGDTVLSPFAGIGSEIYQALKMGRKGVGILKTAILIKLLQTAKMLMQVSRSDLAI
jgi:DNA modification methylase